MHGSCLQQNGEIKLNISAEKILDNIHLLNFEIPYDNYMELVQVKRSLVVPNKHFSGVKVNMNNL